MTPPSHQPRNPANTATSEKFDPLDILSKHFTQAIERAFPDLTAARNFDPLITTSKNPQFGDFQCNAAMSLAKLVSLPPRTVAEKIVANITLDDIAQPLTPSSIAGPGFINISLKPQALASLLIGIDTPTLGLTPLPLDQKQTVIVDLCGVNLAKQMHVGHLRSIIIGDAIARTLQRLGHNVIRQNHVGDWGLPIAMVVDKLMRLQSQGKSIKDLDLDAIEQLYRAAQAECSADEAGLDAALKWWAHPKALRELQTQVDGAREALASAKTTLIRLQSGDPATKAVWQQIADVTMRQCLSICARLHADIHADHSAGESAYADDLPTLVQDLLSRNIAQIDQGAVIVRVEGFEEPCIIRKSADHSADSTNSDNSAGGGFLYATTDLAAIRRRVQLMHASRVIYCVDARQSLHFKLVFGTALKAGYINLPTHPGHTASLEHAAFGTILGPDNKPFKTRSGENVKLSSLLDEAIARALSAVQLKNPELSEDESRSVAQAVGIAAIKYADLSNDRAKDYVFSFDRMLAFEGNTGPYLLYALARIRSIFRKARKEGIIADNTHLETCDFVLTEKDEKNLALALLRYSAVVRSVAQTLEPHRLCQYLYDVCTAFSAFFTNCRVLNAPDEQTRLARLRLCSLTERIIQDGLTLLGIPTLERM